eukprot:UN17458
MESKNRNHYQILYKVNDYQTVQQQKIEIKNTANQIHEKRYPILIK